MDSKRSQAFRERTRLAGQPLTKRVEEEIRAADEAYEKVLDASYETWSAAVAARKVMDEAIAGVRRRAA